MHQPPLPIAASWVGPGSIPMGCPATPAMPNVAFMTPVPSAVPAFEDHARQTVQGLAWPAVGFGTVVAPAAIGHGAASSTATQPLPLAATIASTGLPWHPPDMASPKAAFRAALASTAASSFSAGVGVVTASAVLTKEASKAKAQSVKADGASAATSCGVGAAKKQDKIGSLLAAYSDSDDSASEDAEPGADDSGQGNPAGQPTDNTESVQACSAQRAVVEFSSACHEPWRDFIRPHRRHGLIVGSHAVDLAAGWPRSLSAYPVGHPPSEPPGCCGPKCVCMEGTRKPEESELRKPWIEDDHYAEVPRAKRARLAVDFLSKQQFVVTRGQVSGQHFFETREQAVAKSSGADTTTTPLDTDRQHWVAVSSCATDALRAALKDAPAEEVVAALRAASALCTEALHSPSAAPPVPGRVTDCSLAQWPALLPRAPFVGAFLPARSDYEPLRVDIDEQACQGSPSAPSSSDPGGANQAPNALRLHLFEGETRVLFGTRCSTVQDQQRVSQAAATSRAAAAIRVRDLISAASPRSAGKPLLSEVVAGLCQSDVPLAEWLVAMERVRRKSRALACAHLLWPLPEELEAAGRTQPAAQAFAGMQVFAAPLQQSSWQTPLGDLPPVGPLPPLEPLAPLPPLPAMLQSTPTQDPGAESWNTPNPFSGPSSWLGSGMVTMPQGHHQTEESAMSEQLAPAQLAELPVQKVAVPFKEPPPKAQLPVSIGFKEPPPQPPAAAMNTVVPQSACEPRLKGPPPTKPLPMQAPPELNQVPLPASLCVAPTPKWSRT